MTARLRQRAAEAIGEYTRSVSDVAGEYGMTWPIAHLAFIAYAELLMPAGGPPPAVTVLGIDETRRGKGRYEIHTDAGVKVWIDRFDTGLVDISGSGGLFAQVNGRSSKTVIDRIEQQTDSWRAGITHVPIDTSATYAKVVRQAVPHAIVILDRFHSVALANRAVTDPAGQQLCSRPVGSAVFIAWNILTRSAAVSVSPARSNRLRSAHSASVLRFHSHRPATSTIVEAWTTAIQPASRS